MELNGTYQATGKGFGFLIPEDGKGREDDWFVPPRSEGGAWNGDRVLAEEIRKPIDPMELVYPKELPLFDKYDEYLPEELVKKGFALGVLDVDGLREKVLSWEN